MDPAYAPGTTPKPPVFQDGLGERRRVSDVSGADTIEQLCLRSDLTAIPSFEFALRERASRLANFRHVYYGRVRSVDRLNDPQATLAVVSDAIKGVRLSNLLTASERRPLTLDINASLHLIRQLVSAVAMLHETARDVAHGAIGPERIIVTPNARVVIVEYVLGAALEQLRFSQDRYWKELRIPLPPSSALPHFDHRADVTQIGVVALSLVIGRLLREDEYPHGVGDVLALASAISAKGEHAELPAGIRRWIGRALQLDPRHSFATALEAREALDRALTEDDEDEVVAVGAASAPAAPSVPPPAFPPIAEVRAAESVAPPEVKSTADEPLPASWTFAGLPTPPAKSGWSVAAPAAPEPVERAADTTAAADPPREAGRPAFTPKPYDPPTPALPEFAPAAEYAAVADEPTASARADGPAAKPWGRIAAAAVALIDVGSMGVPAVRKFILPGSTAVATGTLNISSNPPGAAVIVDGQASGVTPLTVALKPGGHNVELRGPGEPRTIPVTITAGTQVTQYIELPKTVTAFGQLQVRTEPAGAQVTVDGIPRGKSPVLVESLAAGEHAVALEAEGANVKQTVTIEAGVTASLLVPLSAVEAAPASGYVSVTAPVELQLFENKRLIGTSQSERLMMTAGKHEIELVNEAVGYRATRSVSVPAGRMAQLKVEWPKGTIAINALPWAEVWIDGERVGETPLGNLSLPIGPHEITFRHPELGEQHYAATVSLKAPARVSVDLRKK
jgi:hypothetical protein